MRTRAERQAEFERREAERKARYSAARERIDEKATAAEERLAEQRKRANEQQRLRDEAIANTPIAAPAPDNGFASLVYLRDQRRRAKAKRRLDRGQ